MAVGIGFEIDGDCDPDPDADPDGRWLERLFSEQPLMRLWRTR